MGPQRPQHTATSLCFSYTQKGHFLSSLSQIDSVFVTETNADEHFVFSPVQAGGEGPAALQQGCPACSGQGVVDDS